MATNFRPGSPTRPLTGASDRNFALKSDIHKKLIGVINYEQLSSVPKERMRSEIGPIV